MLKLDEYYSVLTEYNKTYFEEVLPNDELEELSHSSSEDFEEDANRLNELIGELALKNNQGDVKLVLAEIVAIASGIEGLLRNITDDARDLLRNQYRLNND